MNICEGVCMTMNVVHDRARTPPPPPTKGSEMAVPTGVSVEPITSCFMRALESVLQYNYYYSIL